MDRYEIALELPVPPEELITSVVPDKTEKVIPPRPKPPTGRLIIEGVGSGFCSICHSTMIRSWVFFGKKYCVNPDCEKSAPAGHPCHWEKY